MHSEDSDLSVLFVDDDETDVSVLQGILSNRGVWCESVDPDEVMLNQVLKAQVVLVDFGIKSWQEEAKLQSDAPIGRLPIDGLALAAVLRRHAQSKGENPPTAFAILTGQLSVLADPLPSEYRNHALAHMNNIEWVFDKSDATEKLVRQVISIARAVARLPQRWLPDNNENSLAQLLELLQAGVTPGALEGTAIVDDVTRCLPPIHDLSEWSHGLTILRWLLHRVLPYPSFLYSTHYLAARLGVDHESFVAATQTGKQLRLALQGSEYTGILSGFDGVRWWRPKIESLLWNGLNGQTSSADSIRRYVNDMAGEELPSSNPAYNPVVCINERYHPTGMVTSLDVAVRLQPDDWPSFADYAWATIEDVKASTKLLALVVTADKERVS